MSRKAGADGMSGYVDYLNTYDRERRGAGSEKGTDRFSGLDIRYAHDAAKDFGVNKYDAANQVLQYARRSEDETKMGGTAESALDNLREMLKNRTKNDPKPNAEPKTPTNTKPEQPSNPGQGGGGQKIKDVTGADYGITSPISQDNDISIDGNRNRVNQDNSINQTIDSRDQSDNRRYYGGSNRVFNYEGGDGDNNLYDTPVSKATMGGFYDTDDSPAAAAKFMDMYVNNNILGQRDIRSDYDKRKMTDYGPNDPNRVSELESGLDKSTKDSRNRADEKELTMFGSNPFSGTFKLPKLPKAVEDNTQQIYEDSIERIEKI